MNAFFSFPYLSPFVIHSRIIRKTPNDPHVSEIDNKMNCSLDNIDNLDEEIELPNDILKALEKQDEGSKPNIEELEVMNLAEKGEESKEVKIGTHLAIKQKDELIALLREFREIFAWSYQDMSGLDMNIGGPPDSTETKMQAREVGAATDEARDYSKDQRRGGETTKSKVPEHSDLFGLGRQYSTSAKKGWESKNVFGLLRPKLS